MEFWLVLEGILVISQDCFSFIKNNGIYIRNGAWGLLIPQNEIYVTRNDIFNSKYLSLHKLRLKKVFWSP